MNDGPFTDDMVRHYVKVVQTQHGIFEAVEAMSKVLVEMGRASHKAVGDSPVVAIYRWTDLMRKRALELLREKPTDWREGFTPCGPRRQLTKATESKDEI
jgi:hypothetical protein